MTDEPDPQLADRIAGVIGWRPRSWTRVHGGYTPAARFVARRGDATCFVKIATTRVTRAMLRRELAAYAVLAGPFAPAFIGGEDDAESPFLAIEDLSAAAWPPPWTDTRLADALAAIEALHATRAPLPTFAEIVRIKQGGWSTVALDPAPFLSLALADADWLAAALPALVEAEAACVTAGEASVHFDLRSDNICLTERGAVLVDWAAACRGDPRLDLGGWLPSLHFEGGPPPEAILPAAPEVAAWVSGYFAARAGLPDIPDAPFVRRVQREQLGTALPWAARALGLRAPG